MERRGRGIAKMVLVGTLSASLAACGSGGGTGKTPEQSAAATAPVPTFDTSKPVELTFYGNSTQPQEYFDRYYGDAIRRKFPNYTLKYIQLDTKNKATTLAELVAAGTPIDIYYATIGNFESALTSFDLQVDMTSLIKQHKIDTSRFEPTLLEATKTNTGGPIYGLPVQGNTMVLYYNKTLFDKFGVDYPKDGMTWEQAADIAKKMTRFEDGKQYFGFTIPANHIIRANQLSIPRVDKATDKPTYSTDARWKTFFDTVFANMMQGEAYKQQYAKGNAFESLNGFLKDHTVAMQAYFAQLYLTNPEELKAMNWDIVSLPTFKEAPGVGSQSYPMFFGVTKLSKNADAAVEVIKYMVSDEFQTELSRKGWMSSLKLEKTHTEYAQDTPFMDKNYKALFYNKQAPITIAPKYDPTLVNNGMNAVFSIMRGENDINTAFRKADELGQKAIDDSKVK